MRSSAAASAGQADIASVFEYILRDEVFHAQSGLRWSRELLGSDPEAVLEERAEAMGYFTGARRGGAGGLRA